MSIEKPAFRRREAESLKDRFNIGFAVYGFSGEGSAALRRFAPECPYLREGRLFRFVIVPDGGTNPHLSRGRWFGNLQSAAEKV